MRQPPSFLSSRDRSAGFWAELRRAQPRLSGDGALAKPVEQLGECGVEQVIAGRSTIAPVSSNRASERVEFDTFRIP
jgi:hypothetical protein